MSGGAEAVDEQVELGAEAAARPAQRVVGLRTGDFFAWLGPAGGLAGPDHRGIHAPVVVADLALDVKGPVEPSVDVIEGPTVPPAAKPHLVAGLPLVS